MKKALFTSVLLISTGLAYSQQWGFTNAPRPRDINAIEIIIPNQQLVVAGGNRTNDSIRASFTSNSAGLQWNIDNDLGATSWIKSFSFKDSLNGIAACYGGTILKTVTGGRSWTRITSPINRDFNEVFFVDSLTGFIAGGKADTLQTILKTTNGGQTWNVVRDQQGHWLQSVYFTNASNGIAVGDSGTILRTTNGGNSWSLVTSPITRHFKALWFTDANNGVIVGGNFANDSLRTILTTNNGGASWTVAKDELGGWLTDVHFINQTTGYAVGAYATCFKTTDGGQNWVTETVTPAQAFDHFTSVKFYSATYGIIGAEDGKIFIYNTDPLPEVYTLGSEFVTTTTATLVSGVNTFDAFGLYSFRYSEESNFGFALESFPASVIKSDSIARAERNMLNLTPNTTYYFIAKATTLAGSVYGDTLSFFTGDPPAEFETLDATDLTGTSATLNGLVQGAVGTVTLSFQYGSTAAFGNEVPATPGSVNDGLEHAVEATITGLTPGAVYYFRLKGVGQSGNIYGDTRLFYSGQLYTSLETLLPTLHNDTAANLFGAAAGFKLPATISFEYAIDTPVFTHSAPVATTDSLLNDTLPHQYMSWIGPLQPGLIYYYRIRAKTSVGTFYGGTIAFFGDSNGVRLQTLPASKVTTSSVQLNGSIERFSSPVDITFEYGTDLSFDSEVAATPGSISDTSAYSITGTLNGLTDNTLYYYRIKAETAAGVIFLGNTKQFFTGMSIPNWDFQDWRTDTTLLPVGWNSGGTVERVSGHSGDYAMKLVGPTIALVGFFREIDDGPSFFGGVPLNARPDSISFYMNYDIAPGDTGLVLFNATTGFNTIGGGFYPVTGNSGGVFQRLSFPIQYQLPDVPEKAAFGFAPTNPDGSGISNNVMIVDDIRLSHSPDVVQYGDFEEWYEFEDNTLLNWYYNPNVAIDSTTAIDDRMVERAYFNYPDDFAAEITNREWEATYIIGSISTAPNFNDGNPGFAVSVRHQSLTGFYKYFPEGGDTLMIEVMFFKGDSMIATARFMETDSVTEFTPFEVPVLYYMGGGTGLDPDSANIRIDASTKYVKGGSRAVIDKLKFDGFAEAVVGTPVIEKEFIGMKVFPNPASSSVSIQLEKEIDGTLQVYNATGYVVHEQEFRGNELRVSTADLSEGIYIVAILQKDKMVTNKLIIVR